MKIIINQKNFKRSLNIVEKVVSRNPSLPILNNVLMKTENGRLKLSATNLEIGINCFTGAKIEEPGEIAIPAKILSDFINNLEDDKLTLVTKNNILNVSSDKYKTQILGFDTKEFPIIPKIKENLVAVIPVVLLKSALISTFDSVSLSEARPELAGVYTAFNEKNIIFASTDSFRLTEKIINLKPKTITDFILPRNTVAELIRVVGDSTEDVSIYTKDNQISFIGSDFELISRLVDGNYPDYRRVIPEKFVSKVLVGKEDFEKNTRLAGLFSSNISDIKLSCIEDKIVLNSKNSDKGEIQVSVESLLKNEPFDISLNYQYLLDGIKKMGTDKVLIEFTGIGSPLVLRPADDKKDLTYLIMPFRK